MRARALFLFLAGLGWAGAAAAQPIVTSPAPDDVEFTVYRDPDRGERAMNLEWLNGFALISEKRRVRLPAGESIVRFEGVAGGIVPQSAIVTGFPDGIVERNRDAYLLSPATLLDRSLGRRVHLRRTSRATGEVREQDAVVRSSAEGGVVIETGEGIETLRCTGLNETIVYDEVPPGLSAKPTLSVRTRAAAPVDAVVTLSYLATGFDWQANYIAELAPDGRTVDLFAWLTLGSQDETSFPNADTQAVAGRINYTRAQVPPTESGGLELRCWPSGTTSNLPYDDGAQGEDEQIVVTGSRVRAGAVRAEAPPAPVTAMAAEDVMVAIQEELGDLKLYRIPEPVTVAANSQKQVALLVQNDVRVQIAYRANVASGSSDIIEQPRRFLISRNRTAEGLGVPLPSGGVALFTQRAGRPFLAGQGRLEDRAVGDDVEISFGPTPNIRLATRLLQTNADERWSDYELIVTNALPEPARFEARLTRPDDTRLVPAVQLGERDGAPLWAVQVPANGRATLRYRLYQETPR